MKPVDRASGRGARARHGCDKPLVTLHFPATADATRRALGDLCLALTAAGCAPGMRSRIEMVVAEVLNNVTEHARRAGGGERVRLTARSCGDALCVGVRDRGRPMPGGAPPAGELPDLHVPRDRLPEGGFGWFLIRAQSDGLAYRRAGGRNLLKLRFHPRPPG